VIMEEKKLRSLIPIQAEWSTPQLQENIASALDGTGPALSTSEISIDKIDQDIALVVNTSGSTGSTKLVAISKSALISSANASNKFLGAGIGDTWSLLLPTTHIAGLNVIIRATVLGTRVIDNRNTTSYQDADFVSIVPTQLYKAVNKDPKLLEHLNAAESVLVGGSHLDLKLKKEAETKHVKIVTTYGMTEMSGGCVYSQKPLEGVEFKLSTEGLIQLAGPMMATGYIDNQGKINPFTDNDWFTSSDIGEINNGLLKVIGRTDEIIISGGENISLVFVESEIKKIYPDSEIIVFSLPDDKWGEKLCLGSSDDISLELIKSKLGSLLTPKQIFEFSFIPTTAIGKPDRIAASKLALELGEKIE